MRKIKNEELNRLSEEDFKNSQKINAIIVLDNVRSAMNVGSVFRTADAFRLEKIYLCGITARPPHREINKTALGAQNTVDWAYEENIKTLMGTLRKEGCKIMVVEQTDESISLLEFKPEKRCRYAFVFGNEVFGVTDKVVESADAAIEIPQFGTKHSLNISVSIGVVIWDFISKSALPAH